MSLGFPRPRLDLLHELAAHVLEVRHLADKDALARDLLTGFVDVCLRVGLDGLLVALGVEDDDPYALVERPELHAAVVDQIAKNFDEGGPRSARPRQLTECVLGALGLTVIDEPPRTLTLGDDVRTAVAAAIASVIDVDLAAPRLRANIIAAGRERCDAHYHGAFDKIANQLDERGLAVVRQPKLPLDAVQAVQKALAAARDAVFERAGRSAIDRAKEVLAGADADAAARIDQPITHRLTPRDVASRRIGEPRTPKAPAAVAQLLLDSLSSVAQLAWRAPERVARPYSAKETFAVGELIEHPKFGRGTVTTVAPQRIEVEFPDGAHTLVHAKA